MYILVKFDQKLIFLINKKIPTNIIKALFNQINRLLYY